MNKKYASMTFAVVAVLSLATGAMAYGHGFGGGHMMGAGYGGHMEGGGPMMVAGYGGCQGWGSQGAALTPEQVEKAQALGQEFQAKVEPLQRQLRAKSAMLEAELVAVTPDSGRIDTLAQEAAALRTKLFIEQIGLRKALRDAGLPNWGLGSMRGHRRG